MQQKIFKLRASLTDSRKTPTDKLFADLLKRQAREAMQLCGEVQPSAVPMALRHLRAVEETIRFAIRHLTVPADDCGRSDKQLLNAHTLADILACIELTMQQHRPPQIVAETAQSGALARLERKLDIIAGAIAKDPALHDALFGAESEAA